MNDKFEEYIATSSKKIEQYTYPFLTKNASNDPVVIASCVFINLANEFYLITAAHALRSVRQGIFTRGDGQLIDVSGRATVSRDDTGDNFDIAAIHIDSITIRQHNISTISSLMLTTAVEVQNPHCRAISGFPVSMNKIAKALDRKTNTITSKCYTYFENAEFSGEYERFSKLKDTHIGIELLSGTDDHGKYLSTPNWPPRGISGGGAWLIPNLRKPNEIFLEGIFIEGHRHEKRMFGYSTRIKHVVDFVRQTHNNQINPPAMGLGHAKALPIRHGMRI